MRGQCQHIFRLLPTVVTRVVAILTVDRRRSPLPNFNGGDEVSSSVNQWRGIGRREEVITC